MSAQDGIMQQIEQLLRDGKSSRQVIDMRYNPSSVYKVQRRVRAGASAPITEGNDPTPPTARLGDEHLDPEVESHPEVIELKRELRKVQLQSQIAAVRAPVGTEKRLDSLEKTVSEMAELVVWLATPDENSDEDELGTGAAG